MLAVAHVLGLMMAFFAVTFLMPLICAVIYQDGMFIDFAAAAAINSMKWQLASLAGPAFAGFLIAGLGVSAARPRPPSPWGSGGRSPPRPAATSANSSRATASCW